MALIDIVPGQIVTRRAIHRQLGGQQYGGISTPAAEPVVLIFSGEQGAKYGYYDGFQQNGTYWYTGEGQVGDMTLTKGNRAIEQHRSSGKELLLFEYVRKSEVQFIGAAEYLDHHTAVAPDRNGNARNVIVFELHVGGSRNGTPDLRPESSAPVRQSLWKRSLNSLREEAYEGVPRKDVPDLGGHRITYHRSEVIRAYVLKRARGKCEGCDNAAPFMTDKGLPYLEPHHITRRSDGGPDHPCWVIALCPNCHARVHRGADGRDYNVELAGKLRMIEQQLGSVNHK